MLIVDDIRFMLSLSEEDIPNEDIQRYIDNYTLKIYEYVGGKIDCPKLINSPLFDEALLAGIACHLSMIHPELLIFPSKYRVGDTQEEFSDATLAKFKAIESTPDDENADVGRLWDIRESITQ